MNVCVLGWYGTETLGDRAILDGILLVLKQAGVAKVYLGSLFPPLTQRTLFEDGKVLAENFAGGEIELFNSRLEAQVKKAVGDSDLVMMGGGPIMDIGELFIIKYAFKEARKRQKKTMIFGCGFGPLTRPSLQAMVRDILNYSDTIVLRDQKSYEKAKQLRLLNNNADVAVLPDPAIISILHYKKVAEVKKQDYIGINLRRFPNEYGRNVLAGNDFFRQVILAATQSYASVKLVPMHTFCVGGDDREFFAELAPERIDQVELVAKPLDLYGLYQCYAASGAGIAMRYHAIVMQTLLNGNNYIFDYTDYDYGKINGFLELIKAKEYYAPLYINLQKPNEMANAGHIIGKLLSHNVCLPLNLVESDLIKNYLEKIEE